MEEGGGKRGAPLLPPGQIHDESRLRGEVEELDEELCAGADPLAGHVEDAAEVRERLGDGELSVERQLLRHVTDPAAGNTRLLGPRLAAEHGNSSGLQSLQVVGKFWAEALRGRITSLLSLKLACFPTMQERSVVFPQPEGPKRP